jgi:LPXTG-motif cell wall-anchored protein
MTRTNQGGSALSFVIVALVLAGLLIGGTYTVRRLTTQSDQTQSPPAPAQQDKTPSTDKPQQDGASSTSDQSQASTPQTGTQTQGTNPTQLPQTGPKELMGSIIAIAALSGMAVSYARSRRPELSL